MLFAKDINENQGGGKYMDVGIHTNVELTSIAVEDRWVDINYQNSQGETIRKRVFFPEIGSTTPNDGETIADALKRRENDEFTHLVKHMRIFMSPDEINVFSAPDLRTAAMKFQAILTPRLNTKKLNLKVILDKDGKYAEVPKQAFNKYVEEYVEGQTPTLEFTTWELKNRTTRKPSVVDTTDDTQIY